MSTSKKPTSMLRLHEEELQQLNMVTGGLLLNQTTHNCKARIHNRLKSLKAYKRHLLETQNIMKEMNKQIEEKKTENHEKSKTINNLRKNYYSLKKEKKEFEEKHNELNKLLNIMRQKCIQLFNSRVDKQFAERNAHLFAEVRELYKSENLDNFKYCPAMLYMESVKDAELSQIPINKISDEPPEKRIKKSCNKESLRKLVMNLERRHIEKDDLWQNVLWALYEVGRECGYDTLDIANEFSKQSKNYKSFEAVKKTFESSDGSVSLHYLYDVSEIYEEGLEKMEQYLKTLVPEKYLPLKLIRIDFHDVNEIELTVKCSDGLHLLLFVTDRCVLTDIDGLLLNVLKKELRSSSPILKSLCAEMRLGFTVDFSGDDYIFKSKNKKKSFILNNPLDHKKAYITFSNGRRGKKTDDLQRIYDAVQKETIDLLISKSGKTFKEKNNSLVYVNNKTASVIRPDIDLVHALYAAEPSIKTRYCYSEEKIFYCEPKTNIWEIMSQTRFESHLREYFTNTAELNLTDSELKHINLKKSIANIGCCILGNVEVSDFANKLNSKLQLFITNNKTIDMSIDPPMIRHIEVEDLASMTCGWSYDSELATRYKESVKKFFDVMFPVQSERDWFLSYIAKFLNGKRRYEPLIVIIDQHEGKGGKESLIQLLKVVFGEYYVVNSKIVTPLGSRASNEFSGGLCGLKEKRLLLANGLQETDTLNSSFIKVMTGDNDYYMKHVNTFFKKQFEFIIQAGIVIIVNEEDMPKFDKRDKTLHDRMVVCPLRSRFVTKDEYQEMRNNKNNMANIHIAYEPSELQFDKWASATLDLLIEYFNKPILKVPDSMRAWKKRICDLDFDYIDWINTYIRKSENRNDFVSATQIMETIQNSDSDDLHPRKMCVLKAAMRSWAKENGFHYKARHVYSVGKRRRETKSVLLNAIIKEVSEE